MEIETNRELRGSSSNHLGPCLRWLLEAFKEGRDLESTKLYILESLDYNHKSAFNDANKCLGKHELQFSCSKWKKNHEKGITESYVMLSFKEKGRYYETIGASR